MDPSIVVALVSAFGGALASALILGWVGRSKLADLEIRFLTELSTTRHTLYGRFDQQLQVQKEKDGDQDDAIHDLEVRLARYGINGHPVPRKPRPQQ